MAQRVGEHASPDAEDEVAAQDALFAALLALARDSAEAKQAEQALLELAAVLRGSDGARLSAGARDVFAAALAALRRHPSEADTQRAGTLVLGLVAQKEAEPSGALGGAAGSVALRLNPGRPAEARQRVDAVRAVAAATRLLVANENTFDLCCEALLALRGNDVCDADADIFGAVFAAMRARADSTGVQHVALTLLRYCTTDDFTLRAEVLSCTVAALHRHSTSPSCATNACALLRKLSDDVAVAKLIDRSCFEALVLGLQVQNDWALEALATYRVNSACKALYAALDATRNIAAEQAVEAGTVQRLVALLQSADCNWTLGSDSTDTISDVLLVLSRICQHSHSARRLAVATGAFEPLVRVMRSLPDDALVQSSACNILFDCCFPDSLPWAGPVANVAAAMEAGAPAAVLAAHTAHGERDQRTDQFACCALGAFMAGRRFAMATAYHRRVADALLVSMRRRPSGQLLQRACCWGLVYLFMQASVDVRRSMLDAGMVELATVIVRQFGTNSEAKDVCRVAVAPALTALCTLLRFYGAAAAQQALHAGAVEACLLAVAANAQQCLGHELDFCFEALRPLCAMTARLPAAAARAAACGAHRLAEPLDAVFPAARSDPDFQAIMQQLQRFGALARDHVACGDDACDLCSMSRTRCSLPSCAARNGDGGVAFKRCGRCNCANFCCKEHQVSAWPRHKPLCRVRAVVEEARRELLAQSGTGADAPD